MSTALMAPKRNKRNEAGRAIAQAIVEQYQPKNVQEMQDAIKDIFGPMFEAMLQGEMDSHLGYEANDHGYKETENRRNGYTHKTVKTAYGDVPVDVPRDREATFEPQVIPKRTRDVSGIEGKVLSMYARGMSQRDIADTIEDIYGFEISHETISDITDRVVETAQEWQNRPLRKFYTFVFVDCLYVTVRKDMETKSCAVYVWCWVTTWTGSRTSWDCGSGKRKGNITGCRSLTRSAPVEWKTSCSSAWTGYPAWRKERGRSSRTL